MARLRLTRVEGPLAPYAAGFREELAGQGYASGSARHQMLLMAHVSRWLESRGSGAAGLTDAAAGLFSAARRDAGYSSHCSVRALAPLLAYLRSAGVAPLLVPAVAGSAVDRVVERYEAHLVRERGLAASSLSSYIAPARRFLAWWADGEHLDVSGLDAGVRGH